MSIALYNNIVKVVAYVVSEVAGVVVEVFLTSVSRGVIDSAEKAVVVIVVSVLDKKKIAVFNLVGPVLSFNFVVVTLFSEAVVFEADGCKFKVKVDSLPFIIVLVLAVEVINAHVALVILKFVVLMFNSFPVLPVTVVKADESTVVVTVDSLDAVFVHVLGFLVVLIDFCSWSFHCRL